MNHGHTQTPKMELWGRGSGVDGFPVLRHNSLLPQVYTSAALTPLYRVADAAGIRPSGPSIVSARSEEPMVVGWGNDTKKSFFKTLMSGRAHNVHKILNPSPSYPERPVISESEAKSGGQRRTRKRSLTLVVDGSRGRFPEQGITPISHYLTCFGISTRYI